MFLPLAACTKAWWFTYVHFVLCKYTFNKGIELYCISATLFHGLANCLIYTFPLVCTVASVLCCAQRCRLSTTGATSKRLPNIFQHIFGKFIEYSLFPFTPSPRNAITVPDKSFYEIQFACYFADFSWHSLLRFLLPISNASVTALYKKYVDISRLWSIRRVTPQPSFRRNPF